MHAPASSDEDRLIDIATPLYRRYRMTLPKYLPQSFLVRTTRTAIFTSQVFFCSTTVSIDLQNSSSGRKIVCIRTQQKRGTSTRTLLFPPTFDTLLVLLSLRLSDIELKYVDWRRIRLRTLIRKSQNGLAYKLVRFNHFRGVSRILCRTLNGTRIIIIIIICPIAIA